MLVKHGDFSFLDNPTIYPPKLVLLIAKCEPSFCPDVLNYRTILKLMEVFYNQELKQVD